MSTPIPSLDNQKPVISSLREHYAGIALGALLANSEYLSDSHDLFRNRDFIVDAAIDIADRLVKELRRNR